MSFAPLYLINRFFFRISDFFHHWYVGGSRLLLHRFVSLFEFFDRSFAFHATLSHLWKSPYGDHLVIGRAGGFLIRLFRILIGGVVYTLLGLTMAVFYIVWLILPFAILFMAYRAYVLTSL